MKRDGKFESMETLGGGSSRRLGQTDAYFDNELGVLKEGVQLETSIMTDTLPSRVSELNTPPQASSSTIQPSNDSSDRSIVDSAPLRSSHDTVSVDTGVASQPTSHRVDKGALATHEQLTQRAAMPKAESFDHRLMEQLRDIITELKTDQVREFRQQIIDLKREVHERDSRLSKLRVRQRAVEAELEETKSNLQKAQLDVARLQAQNTTVERMNAQLRVRIARMTMDTRHRASNANDVHKRRPLTQQRKAKSVTLSSKSVHFAESGVNRQNFDEDSIDACLARQVSTDNVSIQTSFLVPNASPQSRTAVPSAADVGNIPMVSEVTHADGTIERIYTNGTQLLITADNQHFFHYANADWRHVDANGVEKYHYAATGMTITTYTDGRRVVKYDTLHESPRKSAQLPTIAEEATQQTSECAMQQTAESIKQKTPTQPTVAPSPSDVGECIEDKTTVNGVRLRRYADGTEIVHFPDGSVETRTKELTTRVFASGDVKYQYKDGQTVTKFVNGRLRVKNADGSVLVDSTPSSDNSSNSTNTHMTSA